VTECHHLLAPSFDSLPDTRKALSQIVVRRNIQCKQLGTLRPSDSAFGGDSLLASCLADRPSSRFAFRSSFIRRSLARQHGQLAQQLSSSLPCALHDFRCLPCIQPSRILLDRRQWQAPANSMSFQCLSLLQPHLSIVYTVV
jgi:hypothetical protein